MEKLENIDGFLSDLENDNLDVETTKGMKSNLLVGRPIYKPFNYPWAYDAWLTQQRIHWLPEEVPLSDDVKDWHKNLTAPEKNVITQIFRFFTQADCFPEETDILTPRGWVAFKDLNEDDLVGQVYDDGKIEFVKPLNRITKDFKGNLLRFYADRKDIDFVVTPTHNIVYEHNGKNHRGKANKVNLYQRKYLRVAGSSDGNKKHLTPEERLNIAFQADGNTKKDCDGSKIGGIQHYFNFTKERKIERLHNILVSGNFQFEENKTNEVTTIKVFLKERLAKDFSWVNLKEVSTSWCQEFMEELAEWDSHKDKFKNTKYSNANKNAVDMAQAISVMGNTKATMSKYVDNRSENFSDSYKLSYKQKNLLDCQHIKTEEIFYDGKVYCVTVPTGNIMIRHNGKAVVSGNCEVNNNYMTNYMPLFKPTEVLMMLSAFSNSETVHIAAYSHLLDTIGMPEVEYSAFLNYKEMKDKYDYMQNFSVKNKHEIAKTLAAFGAFTEGLQLFASFAILLNFPRHNKMKGMGQVVAWSVRDESLHCFSMIKLFRTFIRENPKLWNKKLKDELADICNTIVTHEDAFVDLAFEAGDIEGLTAEDVKLYIRFIADRRLGMLGLDPLYNIEKNPLPWLDAILNGIEHTNFFENRSTEYSKGSTEGTWDEAFS
jgi:ribonucleoside-diphosphate reductase beta chain